MRRAGRICAHLLPLDTASEGQVDFPFTPSGGGHEGFSVRITPNAATTTRENTDKWKLVKQLADKGRRCWKLELVEDDSGETVAWCCFIEQAVRIGAASVVAGNVTGVGCWTQHRRKGHAGVVIEAAVAYMASKGMMVTLLLGIPNFYHQFGYVAVGVQHKVVTKASTLLARLPAPGSLAAEITILDATKEDIPSMFALYSAENKGRSGTLDRPLSLFEYRVQRWIEAEEKGPLFAGEGAFVLCQSRVAKLVFVSEDLQTARARFYPMSDDNDGDSDAGEVPEEEWEESALLPASEFQSMSQSRFSVLRKRSSLDSTEATGADPVVGYFCWSPPRMPGLRPWGGADFIDWGEVPLSGWVQADSIGAGLSENDKESAKTQLKAPPVLLLELAAPPLCYAAIAAHLAAAVSSPGGRLELSVPRDHGFAEFCRRLGSMEISVNPWSESNMMRILDLGALVDTLAEAEWPARKARAPSAVVREWSGAFTIATPELGRVTLFVNKATHAWVASSHSSSGASGAQTLTLPQHKLTQLLFGTVSLDVVAYDADVELPSDAGTMAILQECVFANALEPWRWQMDNM
eukprot:COSAG05_NODE_1496_length_4709_cov_2.773970_1_plen_578_part_00